MNTIIGFLLIEYSVTGLIVFVFGYDLELKEKLKMVFGVGLFLSILTIGVVMINWS